jgi:hypothetical protein
MEEFKEFTINYSVSNYGRIRYDITGNFRTLQIRDKKNPKYKSINIRGKNYFVHRLVALHFVLNNNPEEFNIVNHIDNNPSNNFYLNLEWTNVKGNIKHCYNQNRHTCQVSEASKKTRLIPNQMAKVRRKRNNNLPIGVRELKLKNKSKYSAYAGNKRVGGRISLGSYDTVQQAFEQVKNWYFNEYGVDLEILEKK